MPFAFLFAALLAFCGAWFATALVRGYVLRTAVGISEGAGRASLLDIPNHRSSHVSPTPRGGGVAVVIVFVSVTLWLALSSAIAASVAIGLICSASMVAIVGFLDDKGYLVSSSTRLLIHFAAASFFLICVDGVPPFVALGYTVRLGWLGNVLAAIYLVWMVNLYNFMDGIDGIASVEAITVALGGALVWWLASGGSDWTVPVIFAATVAGFLVWNHPPAKIFMGDSGSCFIGMTLGAMSIWAGLKAPHVFWGWAILIGCFSVDATVTLLRRLIRGKRFDDAHRSHAYQYAARKWGSHRRVTYAYGLVNIFWLLPLACLVAIRQLDGVLAFLIAYAPLIAVAFFLKAGAPERQESEGAKRKEEPRSDAMAKGPREYRKTAEVDGA